MKNFKLSLYGLTTAAMLAVGCSQQQDETVNFTRYVDPTIGTGGHGHVFVGANVPFGMVQLGPTSIPQEWDWTSGYHISDSTVIGFSHTHLSGTGIGDLFDVTVMPVVGEVRYVRGEETDPESGLWSYAERSKEVCRPGYYSVRLARYGVDVELTATERVGFHKYTFPEKAAPAVVFDLESGGCWDKAVQTRIERIDDRTIAGYRYSSGWAKDQKLWFTAEFSRPFEKLSIVDAASGADSDTELTGEKIYGRVDFAPAADRTIYVKVALSPVSVENARENMAAELAGWDFDATVAAADAKWNRELSKVAVETADESTRRIFYTALYHTMIAPSLLCDVNGDYRGADGVAHSSDGFVNYTTFSLWDTYRAAHPLMSIIHPEKVNDMINTMLYIYSQQGKLPVWHLMGCETDCMVGNPGICVVADAVTKGYDGFDRQLALEAMRTSAMLDERGQDLRKQYGYIPCDLFNESVAYDMEYAIADWALAQAAAELGDAETADYFTARSRSYRNFYDPATRFMRGRDSKGKFREPFSPFASTHREDDYCEGNGWQYTWLVPHDLKGLIECFGSREQLITKLDSLFTVSSVVEGAETSPDISGLIGQYAHGNEPSHHVLYFYTMLDEPWKTADRVREVMRTLYRDAPDGLSGNEDVGQMSAWYVLSALGMYQVEPAGGRYWFGSPSIDRATIKVAGGEFVIEVNNNSDANRYIRSIRLNGLPYKKNYIDFEDIAAGGRLEIEMDNVPCLWYRTEDDSVYVSNRPAPEKRLFVSPAIEQEIVRVQSLLTNPKLRWMFGNCFPNTLDTTVHYRDDEQGRPDTYVYTGDIPAMWLRDSGAQVWPYVQYADRDPKLKRMIAGVINRQFKLINIDPYANAFNDGATGAGNEADEMPRDPWVFERKWEIDSHCYPIRLAYHYWKTTGDDSVFGAEWVQAMRGILSTMIAQQRKEGHGEYEFLRVTDRQLDTKCCVGRGNPVRPVGLIASSFRPSDDATTFEFLVPSNFFAVTSLRKAAEILSTVNGETELADSCRSLADEVAAALREYAVYDHPKYGKIYAFEVDGFDNRFLMDDANVPSLLSMPYLGDVSLDDPIYRNTRRFVWSEDNPYFYRGRAGEGIGGPHIGVEAIWPMSIMMRAFTSTDDAEIRHCIEQLLATDAGCGFIHESFHKDNAEKFTREWFAWQNTLFGELIIKLIDDGKLDLLNSIQ